MSTRKPDLLAVVLLAGLTAASCTKRDSKAGKAGKPAIVKAPSPEQQARHHARAWIGLLAAGQFKKAHRQCGEAVKRAMGEAKLQILWQQLIVQAGAYLSMAKLKVQRKAAYSRTTAKLKFETGEITLVTVFDQAFRVVGIFLPPDPSKHPPWTPPAYANAKGFHEQPVVVGQGPLALPGTLTLPKGTGRVAGVVLVHGSGPQDRDETIGPTKIFKDLAWGLATKGIAVLRYDKVTKAHGAKVAQLWADTVTLDLETTDDALRAVALLRKHPRIDPARIYLLGHSQGGLAAPRAGQRDPKLAGLIIMAGPTRPLEDVVVAQYKYIHSLGGAQAALIEPLLPGIVKAAALVKSRALTVKTPPKDLPLGIPASFWLDTRGYRPAQVAGRLAMPIIVLQGEADYQVTLADLTGWKRGLAGHKKATFRRYPQLGHTFMDCACKLATPATYQLPGHVAKGVIGDIARFVLRARSASVAE